MATNVYVDGLNLYHGLARPARAKWLDIDAMCQKLLANRPIHRIRYFYAIVQDYSHNPRASHRQQLYLRALSTIPHLTKTKGHYVSWPKWLPGYPIIYPNNDTTKPPINVQVMKTEEKGSDVNLAAYLLLDCFNNDFDEAVVISNDSDLKIPIEMVTGHFNKPVIVVNPDHARVRSSKLVNVATTHIPTINFNVARSCQFPVAMTDQQGPFQKPPEW